jgi:hypothetical protein
MNQKRYWLAALVVFVGYMAMDSLVHMVLLADLYDQLEHLWRPDAEMQKLFPVMWLGTAIFTLLFVYIFTKGYENKGIAEGVRYGIIIGIFMGFPMAFGSYAMYPMPFKLAIYWFVSALVEMTIAGVLAAAVYRPKQAAA